MRKTQWEVTLQRYKLNEALWLPAGEGWVGMGGGGEDKLGKRIKYMVKDGN